MMWWLFITMICFHTGETKLEDLTPICSGVSNITFETGIIELPMAPFKNVCIEDLGCFYNGPPFYDRNYRPCSCVPEECEKTQYLLFTPTNKNDSYQLSLTEENISYSPINPDFPTKILIHGYYVDLEESDARFLMKDELLRRDKFNVIIIDWTKHNKGFYNQAFSNGRVVGAQIAKLVTLCVKSKGVNLQMVHIIGHSLGAHIAGWAGERLDKVARISGLDPAGPYFQHAPNAVRLDISDASFVDVIHTNGGTNIIEGLGIFQAIGHMDFYPNGGNHQPGCAYISEMEETQNENFEILFVNSCDHNRANDFYIESINGYECSAVQCENYKHYKDRVCTEENSIVSVMGFNTKKLEDLKGSPTFFLTTSRNKKPFCLINDAIWFNRYDRYNIV